MERYWLGSHTFHPIMLVEQYSEVVIAIDKIDCYTPTGERTQETVVHGGGSNLKDTVIGGVVAGGAGAVLGSCKEISSHTTTHDD